MSKKFQLILFALSIAIHAFYYVSAYFTHTLDIFFEHVTMGQDFFQIPNAVYAFLHGGTLTGSLPPGVSPYINCCGVNTNVYHPLFTLLVGYPLQLFSPWIAFAIWAGVHAATTIFLLLFLIKRYGNHKYLYLALSLFLLNSYHYYEIQHAQYQFLVNLFTVLFISFSLSKGERISAGVSYCFSLLVKPIGLLWIPPLLFQKKFTILFIGVGLFLMLSIPLFLWRYGTYYFINFYNISTTPIASYNLIGIYHLIPSIQPQMIKQLGIVCALLLLLYQFIKKPHFFVSIFSWVAFQLIFYSYVFHYQYSILAGLFCIGILVNAIPVKKLTMIPIIFLTLPTPIVFFHLAGDPATLPFVHLTLIAMWSIFWLFCFLLALFFEHSRKHTNI